MSFAVGVKASVDFRSQTCEIQKTVGWRCDEAASLKEMGSVACKRRKGQCLCDLVNIRSVIKRSAEIAKPGTISAASGPRSGPL